MKTENEISKEHITNNKSVRKTLLERWIIPEELPPSEDLKKVERKLNTNTKKWLNTKWFKNKN
jgi:DNA-damage-inducible protein D